ncbi:hypothetical protein Lal_00010831 [Lupinus albus]|nr:hypothetical protein Lal_00010831 [Lupinus albus]
MSGIAPKFAQLYIYDTENEIQNRFARLRDQGQLDLEIVSRLSAMLDEYNTHVKSFRMAKERYQHESMSDLRLKLIADRVIDGRIYNMPTVSEITALIVGDVDNPSKRDIILEKQNGKLKRINELHTSYLGYQYRLLFPYGEDGYRHDVCYSSTCSRQYKRNRVTIKDWLSFRLQARRNETETLLRSRRLFQQFLVDCYCMMEAERLNWVWNNQTQLRVDKYNNLNSTSGPIDSQGANKGKRIILPSSFVGGRRYMDQLYFDGMAISSFVGFPDLFITFTCNPNWLEINKLLSPMQLKPQDRPDIISRVFKIKFDQFLMDLKKHHVLSKVLGYMYTIEFQKGIASCSYTFILASIFQLTDQQLQNLTLLEIENLLQINRKSLRDYPSMPYPEGRITSQLGNRLIYAERDYDKEELKAEFIHCFNLLTSIFNYLC